MSTEGVAVILEIGPGGTSAPGISRRQVSGRGRG